MKFPVTRVIPAANSEAFDPMTACTAPASMKSAPRATEACASHRSLRGRRLSIGENAVPTAAPLRISPTWDARPKTTGMPAPVAICAA